MCQAHPIGQGMPRGWDVWVCLCTTSIHVKALQQHHQHAREAWASWSIACLRRHVARNGSSKVCWWATAVDAPNHQSAGMRHVVVNQ
jgi:hypothetical protein